MTVTRWSVEIVEDPNQPGELLLDLGQALCDTLGWKVGDQMKWLDNGDGSWTLKKIQTP
jgi:hypothetical protein